MANNYTIAEYLKQHNGVLKVWEVDIVLLQDFCFSGSRELGFWGDEAAKSATGKICEFNFGEKIALAHSELSEALEANRKKLESDHLPGIPGEAEELADCVIRCFDLAGAMGYNLGDVILKKLHFNLSRGYKHGKAY